MQPLRVVSEDDGVPIEADAIKLQEIAFGEISERFSEELKKVAANILDFGCPGKSSRDITIKLSLKPAEDRRSASMSIAVTTKLATRRPIETVLYLEPVGNKIKISENNPETPKLQFK